MPPGVDPIPVFVAFAAGVLSIISPCVLSLVPVYLTYLSGISLAEVERGSLRAKVFLHACLFVAGFTVVFVGFGASATLLGRLLLANQKLVRQISAVIVIAFGIHTMGVVRVPWLEREKRYSVRGKQGYFRSFSIGVAFAAGWSPCVGPILGSILLYAGTTQTVWQGMGLLLAYAAGLSTPFLALGLSLGSASKLLSRLRTKGRVVSIASGIFLVVLGVSLYTDLFTRLPGFFNYQPFL